MKIVFNSDHLYHTYLITDRLHPGLGDLFRAIAQKRHSVVIPRTTLLEFQYHQHLHAEEERHKLARALKALRAYGIDHEPCDPAHLVKEPDLIELIRSTGVAVAVEEPTLQDYEDAHRRACCHEPPLPPDTKSDEMRDLVIWAIALRIARADEDQVLLVSRDRVHTAAGGHREAEEAGLVRVRSIDDALAFLQVDTPAGQKIRELFSTVWDDLISEGLPLSETPELLGVSGARFVHGRSGPARVDCRVRAKSDVGGEVSGDVRVSLDRGVITELKLTDIELDGDAWSRPQLMIQPRKRVWAEVDDYEDRILAFQQLLT